MNSQILDNLSSIQCHILTNKAETTSNISFERSFAELQIGHQFSLIFLIAWVLNTDKHVVRNFLSLLLIINLDKNLQQIEDMMGI